MYTSEGTGTRRTPSPLLVQPFLSSAYKSTHRACCIALRFPTLCLVPSPDSPLAIQIVRLAGKDSGQGSDLPAELIRDDSLHTLAVLPLQSFQIFMSPFVLWTRTSSPRKRQLLRLSNKPRHSPMCNVPQKERDCLKR